MSLGYEVRTWIPSGVTTTVCPGGGSGVGPGLDREDHARLDDGVVADVEERRLVVAQADCVADVLAPVGQQVVVREVREHRTVDVGAGHSRTEGTEGHLLGRDRVVEEPAHLVRRLADDHRALQLGVVAPDRRAGLGDEDVALLELDVVGDRVRPRAPKADLAAVAGRDAVGGRLLAAVRAVERLQHRERGLVPSPQAGLGLGCTGPRVLLQQPVGVLAPARTLADQADL
jgi:hypothetical protein